MKHRERLVAALFLLPACGLIALFMFWPVASMVVTSLQDRPLVQVQGAEFTGLDNYRAVFDDPKFRNSVRNTIWFTLAVVPGQTLVALLLAVWTNLPGVSRRALRLVVFIPTTISLTVLSILWKLMYEPASATGSGLLNGLLLQLHLPAQPFLTSTSQAMWAIILMSIWQGVGLQMMVFLSGLQQIPQSLYEAAAIDGSGRWRRFRHVTLPGIAPTAAFVVMFTTFFALKLFVQPVIMTRGGPQQSTISVVQYIYEAAFFQRDLGLACAASVLFFITVCGIAAVQRGVLHRLEGAA